MRRRGFTLVEVMVAVGIFVIITAGAFMFAQQQIRTRKQTEYVLDTEQNARVTIDAIRRDLQLAGLGSGYRADGTFSGLDLGVFGGGQFNSSDFNHGASVSDDLRIRGAYGPARSIATYDAPAPGNFEVCGGAFPEWVAPQPNELAVMVDEAYTVSRVIEITNVNVGVGCTDSQCLSPAAGGLCDRITFINRGDLFQTDGSALNANYSGGTLFRGFFDALYFVQFAADGPDLFRVDLTRDLAGAILAVGAPSPCFGGRGICAVNGNLMGEGVESVHFRVIEQRPPTFPPPLAVDNTVAFTAAGGIDNANRIRIDVEVIARSRTQEVEGVSGQVCSSIAPGVCFPAVGTDRFRRRVLSSSVELKNTGHMQFGVLN
ncbi:MAG: prepilin-type N-terminal cleavage/methylation domain-containing protein [Deltaproteobacteria bacterium]|nr:prepilin-type N-terminal cleavage/methylation domain-containing protein [Deltaproteobacteria bacterium]